jgi:gas vesicle protein
MAWRNSTKRIGSERISGNFFSVGEKGLPWEQEKFIQDSDMKSILPLALVATAALALTACDQAAKDAQTTVEKTGDGVEAVTEEANRAVETGVSEVNEAAVATTEAVQAVATEVNDAAKTAVQEVNAAAADTATAAGGAVETAVGEANEAVLETGDAVKDVAEDIQNKVE